MSICFASDCQQIRTLATTPNILHLRLLAKQSKAMEKVSSLGDLGPLMPDLARTCNMDIILTLDNFVHRLCGFQQVKNIILPSNIFSLINYPNIISIIIIILVGLTTTAVPIFVYFRFTQPSDPTGTTTRSPWTLSTHLSALTSWRRGAPRPRMLSRLKIFSLR